MRRPTPTLRRQPDEGFLAQSRPLHGGRLIFHWRVGGIRKFFDLRFERERRRTAHVISQTEALPTEARHEKPGFVLLPHCRCRLRAHPAISWSRVTRHCDGDGESQRSIVFQRRKWSFHPISMRSMRWLWICRNEHRWSTLLLRPGVLYRRLIHRRRNLQQNRYCR